MKTVTRSLVSLTVVSLALAGCTSVRQSLGGSKSSPDETAVTARAPLAVPATFQLKTPQPGAPRPQDSDAAASAQRVLGATPKVAAASQGETALLAATGADKADPNVRQDLRREVVAKSKRKSYADTVLFWRGGKDDPGTPINAAEEAERINSSNPAPVIEKGEAETPAPSKQEKQNADKESDGGWFDWF